MTHSTIPNRGDRFLPSRAYNCETITRICRIFNRPKQSTSAPVEISIFYSYFNRTKLYQSVCFWQNKIYNKNRERCVLRSLLIDIFNKITATASQPNVNSWYETIFVLSCHNMKNITPKNISIDQIMIHLAMNILSARGVSIAVSSSQKSSKQVTCSGSFFIFHVPHAISPLWNSIHSEQKTLAFSNLKKVYRIRFLAAEIVCILLCHIFRKRDLHHPN